MADNLRHVFDQIAPGWYNFRHRTIFRRELEALAVEWGGGRLLNIGCGHGADFLPFVKGFDLHGIDFSIKMLWLAQRYAVKYHFQPSLVQADATSLPYQTATFDHAIAVAAYHHLRTVDRVPAFRELRRVLKPGGAAFITVWNRWQPRFWLKGNEVMVPWRGKGQTLYRYYNLFSYGEIVKVAREAGFQVRSVHPESPYRLPMRSFSRNVCLVIARPA